MRGGGRLRAVILLASARGRDWLVGGGGGVRGHVSGLMRPSWNLEPINFCDGCRHMTLKFNHNSFFVAEHVFTLCQQK